ncbi:hypothetical protein [Streptomyces sp. 11-1-2]|uniref:hypothetical protein n=1 Tax=unclassified Streptomyces TaxID=2593676 RepID=UPI001F096365|nr:hypothetical protein [Streptomyces sp. 11-1-2]
MLPNVLAFNAPAAPEVVPPNNPRTVAPHGLRRLLRAARQGTDPLALDDEQS